VLAKLEHPIGEFTVVVAPAPTRAASPGVEPSDEDVVSMFGQITRTVGVTRREAVREVSARLGLPVRQVYAAIERSKA
jgi:hypothetical protein